MKKNRNTLPGLQMLNSEQMILINGGDTPGARTSAPNDISYYLAYGFFGLVDFFKGMGRGAAKGQSLRFSG